MATHRPNSAVPQFVRRIPSDVKERAIGRTLTIPLGLESTHITITEAMTAVRFSLRTKDRGEARAREAQASAYLEEVWQSLRKAKPVALDHKQATALAGDMYRGWTVGPIRETAVEFIRGVGWVKTDVEHDLKEALYESLLEKIEEEGQPEEDILEKHLGSIVDGKLLEHGIAAVDIRSRPMLLRAFFQAFKDAIEARNKQVHGDYSPDPKAQRFPEWEEVAPEKPQAKPATTLTQLVEDWWMEAKAAGRKEPTYVSYRSTFAQLVRILGHDDASKVTGADIVKFKDQRLREVSARTVATIELGALRSVFRWAVANHKLRHDPTKGVTVKLGKVKRTRGKGFTEEEAKAILAATRKPQPERTLPQTAAAIRWVPWLCAYTGARVAEMCQLRKEDLKHKDGVWVLHITPEAGTVKTNEARDVALHPHLVEMGFLEFVHGSKPGPLFVRAGEGGDVLGPIKGLKNRLTSFVRKIVTDPNVAPNHGWRHRFKTVGMESGIPPRILDAIQGHAAASVADSYGHVSVKTMAEAIEKFPRIEVEA